MISHKNKCIFIHIPGTNTDNIEKWLLNGESLPEEEKYLNSFQAKELYKDYWDDYFKFSIVRNPFNRINSLISRFSQYGITVNDDYGRMPNFVQYNLLFGFPLVLEYDTRFFKKEDIFRPATLEANCVYKNTLAAGVDKVYKIEQTPKEIQKDLAGILGCPVTKLRPSNKEENHKMNYIANLIVLHMQDFHQYQYEMNIKDYTDADHFSDMANTP